MEIIIEVDKNDRKIGLRPRREFYTGKYIHRSVHLILINSKNEILLQLRSKTKKWDPSLYTYSVSGTVADETYLQCIKRETKEEIGISPKVKKLFKYSYLGENNKSWHCIFIAKSDNKITPDKSEIDSIKWIKIDNLRKDIIENPDIYTPSFIQGISLYFNNYL